MAGSTKNDTTTVLWVTLIVLGLLAVGGIYFNGVIAKQEGLDAFRQEMNSRFDGLRQDINSRFDGLSSENREIREYIFSQNRSLSDTSARLDSHISTDSHDK